MAGYQTECTIDWTLSVGVRSCVALSQCAAHIKIPRCCRSLVLNLCMYFTIFLTNFNTTRPYLSISYQTYAVCIFANSLFGARGNLGLCVDYSVAQAM